MVVYAHKLSGPVTANIHLDYIALLTHHLNSITWKRKIKSLNAYQNVYVWGQMLSNSCFLHVCSVESS